MQQEKLSEIKKGQNKKWQPESAVIFQLTKETLKKYRESIGIIDIYGSLNKPTRLPASLDKMVKAAAFLMHKDQTIKQLVKLNDLLVAKAKKQGLIACDSNDNFVIVPYDKNEVYTPHRKLLSTTLEGELAKFGFQPEFIQITDNLSPTLFRETLRNSFIAKDPGAKLEHGEFSHAIQWLMIAWEQQESGFLNDGDRNDDSTIVRDIYNSFGDENTVYSRYSKAIGFIKATTLKPLQINYERTLWDDFLDVSPTQDSQELPHFRSPENLNRFLLETGRKDLSFLQSLIKSRYIKRNLITEKKNKPDEAYKKNYPPKEYQMSSLPFVLFPKKIQDNGDLKHLAIKEDKKVKEELLSLPSEWKIKLNKDAINDIDKCLEHAVRYEKNDPKTGLAYYYRAKDLLLKAENPDLVKLRDVIYKIASIYYGLGRLLAAEANLLKALHYDKLCPESSQPHPVNLKQELGAYQHSIRHAQHMEDIKDKGVLIKDNVVACIIA